MEILKALAGLKDGNKSSTGDKTNQISESKQKETFASKHKNVVRIVREINKLYAGLKTDSSGKKITTREYNAAYKKFNELVSEWEKTATTRAEKNQVQGVKDLIKNFSVQ